MEEDVYGSGLNSEDWRALRDAIWPFLHAQAPARVRMPRLPKHLKDHQLVRLIRKYRETGDEKYLDRAGRILIPTKKPFGWYLALTK